MNVLGKRLCCCSALRRGGEGSSLQLLPSQLPFATSQQGPMLSLALCGPACWLDWLLSVSAGPRSLQKERSLYPFKSLPAWEAADLDGEPGVAAPLVPPSGWPSLSHWAAGGARVHQFKPALGSHKLQPGATEHE